MRQFYLFLILFFSLIPFLPAQETYTVFVSSRATSSVKNYDLEGKYLGNFVAPGYGGLSGTEDILFHPDGRILVSGFQNTAIKSYDGESGLYLGDFSNGYTLATPSKMSIGPDSLIYVTQWGTTQNKVVRFDLDGNFVDEFTNVGVSNGLGHIWDIYGDFYIAQYGNGGNGIIRRFDPDGNDLGTFVNSAILQGPTNIWWGPGGDLFITDWTVGNVLRYSSSGSYKGVWATGMVNPEGVATLPNGDVLIGDWGVDAVHRFDSLGTSLGMFNSFGGLVDPNSVRLLTRQTSATYEPTTLPDRVAWIGPGPDGGYTLEMTFPVGAQVHSRIVNAMGQCLAIIHDQEWVSGQSFTSWNAPGQWTPGVYYIQVRTDSAYWSFPFSIR